MDSVRPTMKTEYMLRVSIRIGHPNETGGRAQPELSDAKDDTAANIVVEIM